MTEIKTLCTRCLIPIIQQWPDMMTFGAKPCTAIEYISKAVQSESVYIVCDKCLSELVDVRIDDLILYEDSNIQTTHKSTL